MLELNELTPRLLFRFIEEGHLPNFKSLYDCSHAFITDAAEEIHALNPWVQWYTVHTGVKYDVHKVLLLGEGYKQDRDTLPDILSRAGRKVWICGSMNIGFKKPINGAVVPDAWASDVQSYPETLETFREFVQQNVQEHTNPNLKSKLSQTMDFLSFMLRNGLSAKTSLRLVKQIVNERFKNHYWKRPCILDNLQWDLFKHVYSRDQPEFATFFSNSVAHLQHTHWREFEPDKFVMKPSRKDLSEYRNAILYGYKQNDELVGRAMELATDETMIIFCTALSQKPAVEWDETGGKAFYRPFDFGSFTEFAGLDQNLVVRPIMAEQFRILCQSDAQLDKTVELLKGITVDQKPCLRVKPRGLEIYTGCKIHHELSAESSLSNSRGDEIKFGRMFYKSQDLKSGRHDPDGLFWIGQKGFAGKVHEPKISLTRIAPTILKLLGVAEKPSQWDVELDMPVSD